jgi:hypothetical protein
MLKIFQNNLSKYSKIWKTLKPETLSIPSILNSGYSTCRRLPRKGKDKNKIR